MLAIQNIKPELYDIILDIYDILIEIMKYKENLTFLKNRSNIFMNMILDQFELIEVERCTDLNFKIISITNLILSELIVDGKRYVFEEQIKKASYLFFESKIKKKSNTVEPGSVIKFKGIELF